MENDREMERQMEYRRRKQLKKLQRNIFFIILGMILALYGIRIRQLGVSLTKVQTTLKQIEVLQQKATENGSSSDAEDIFGEYFLFAPFLRCAIPMFYYSTIINMPSQVHVSTKKYAQQLYAPKNPTIL